MLMIGAASAATASDSSYLGNWARADGKTHIRVEPCGKSVCGVNTWVRPGMKHEKVGDRLVLNISPAGASLGRAALSIRSAINTTQSASMSPISA